MKVEIPMRLPSTANLRLHWAAKAKMAKEQREAVAWALKGKSLHDCPLWWSSSGLVVTLTRVAPRSLDDDNLVSAAKFCRDQVADWLGINDNDSRVTWKYAQAKGKPAVVIEFSEREVLAVLRG